MTKQHYGRQAHSIGARYPYHPMLRGDRWYVVNLETGLYSSWGNAHMREWANCAGAMEFIDRIILPGRPRDILGSEVHWAPHPKDAHKPAVRCAPVHSKFVHSTVPAYKEARGSVFVHQGSASGRISSDSPALSNIPKRAMPIEDVLKYYGVKQTTKAAQDTTRSGSAEYFKAAEQRAAAREHYDACLAIWNRQKAAALAQVYPGRYDDWKDIQDDYVRMLFVRPGDEQTNDYAGFPYA